MKRFRMWLGWFRGGIVLTKDDAYAIIRSDMTTMFDIAADLMDEGWVVWKTPRNR